MSYSLSLRSRYCHSKQHMKSILEQLENYDFYWIGRSPTWPREVKIVNVRSRHKVDLHFISMKQAPIGKTRKVGVLQTKQDSLHHVQIYGTQHPTVIQQLRNTSVSEVFQSIAASA
jgi:hypothetical protein